MSKKVLSIISVVLLTIVLLNFFFNENIIRTPLGSLFIYVCAGLGGLSAGMAYTKD